MKSSRIPSPSRSQGTLTPRQYKKRRTRSVGSPALSTASGRLTSIIQGAKDLDSFILSPVATRRSVLDDNTDIVGEPRRKSWWKNLNENSTNMMEILQDNNLVEPENILQELDIEVVSPEKKNYSIDLPESSDSESINSIVMPQRKLFTENVNQHHKKFDRLIPNREALNKLSKTNTKPEISDIDVNKGTKELFQNIRRSKPVFPAALLYTSPEKTMIGNKTKELLTGTDNEPKQPTRNLFGNRQNTNRLKNMFANFIVSESDDEIPDIQPKIFGFPKKSDDHRRSSVVRRLREPSPASSITTDIEMDDWRHLPSSTMVENQLEIMIEGTPVKKIRLSKLSEKESESGAKNNTIQSNKSVLSDVSKRKSKTFTINKSNTSISTRSQSKTQNVDQQMNINDEEVIDDNLEPNNDQENNITLKQVANQGLENSKQLNKTRRILKQKTPPQNTSILTRSRLRNSRDANEVHVNQSLTREVTVQKDNSKEKSGNNQNDKDNIQTIVTEYEPNYNQDIPDHNDPLDEEEIEPRLIYEEDDDQLENNVEENIKSMEEQNEYQKNNQSQEKNYENQQSEVEDEIEENVDERDNQEDDENQEPLDECQEAVDESEEVADECVEAEDENNEVVDESQEEVEEKVDESNEEIVDNNEHDGEEGEEIEEEVNESQEEVKKSQEKVNESQEEEVNESQDEVNESQEEVNESQEEVDENQEEVSVSQEEENDNQNEINESQEKVDESQEEIDESQEEVHENQDEANESQEEVDQSQEAENESQDEVNESQEGGNESQEEVNESLEAEEDEERLDGSPEATNQSHDMVVEDEENDDDNGTSNEVATESEQEEMEIDENVETPNISHDTTGRNRKKLQSPEVVLQKKHDQNESFSAHNRSTNVRKTSIIKNLNIRPSLAPAGESTGFSEGTSNEESGWDSHRTTRKTIRQTFGKDATMRKSLRALVMEKSAKIQTYNKEASETAKFPIANSTLLPPEISNYHDDSPDDIQEPIHEVSLRTRQTTLKNYLLKIKKDRLEKVAKMERTLLNELKKPKAAIVPLFPTNSTKLKPRVKKQKPNTVLDDIPEELLADLQYKPPKRFKAGNAPWITKRLYKFLETKLEPKYDYKARVRAEKLVETIYNFTKDLRRHKVAPTDSVEVLKHEMARLDIVSTHFDFYRFFRTFMPRDITIKVIPDVVNKIPQPRQGVFSNIIHTRAD